MRRILTYLQRRRAVALVAVLALFLGAGVAAGVASAATTGHTGTSVTRVSVLTHPVAATYSGTAWVAVGSTAVYATGGQFVTARFTAESACYGAKTGWCSIRILIDAIEAEPVVGTDFAFNSPGDVAQWESLTVERVKTVATTGTHIVTVQAASVGGSLTHRLDDWSLTAMAVTP